MRARIALAAFLALPASALADDAAPAVGLLDVRPAEPSNAKDAARTREALESGLAQFRVRVPGDHPAVAAAHAAGKDVTLAAGIEKARARAKEGKALFEKQDPIAAEKKFREAADLFEANAAGLTTPDDLVGAYLFLSRIFFATQREVLIRDVFKRVVQLDPDLILDRAVYPGSMIRVYDEVKGQILASPLGTMRIEASPNPARVFLDGKDRGVTPLDLRNIPPGVHSLTVRRTGYAPYFRPAEVTSFRTDRVVAELVPDRHPSLELVIVPKGTEIKDSLGLTVTDYLAGVAQAAALDVVIVGRLLKLPKDAPPPPDGNVGSGSHELQVRLWSSKAKAYSDVKSFRITPGRPMDAIAEALLLEAAANGWVPPLAARRNVQAGGGALDPTAPLGVRVAFTPAYRLAGESEHFPRAPSAGFRVGFDYRLASRLVLSLETGFDGLVQDGMELEDEDGQELDAGTGSVSAVYTSIPLMAGARYYLGVSTWAPYASGGAGITYDSLAWRESLRYDSLSSPSGIGFGGFAGLGVERALAARSALTFEARASFDKPTVGDAKLETKNISGSRTVPVDGGTGTGLRLSVGYLKIF